MTEPATTPTIALTGQERLLILQEFEQIPTKGKTETLAVETALEPIIGEWPWYSGSLTLKFEDLSTAADLSVTAAQAKTLRDKLSPLLEHGIEFKKARVIRRILEELEPACK